METQKISLDGTWDLYGFGPKDAAPASPEGFDGHLVIPAEVPGNVELDLFAAGKITDPYQGANIYDLEYLEYYTWWFVRTFEMERWSDDVENIDLVFDGIDCFGEVWLNGTLVGTSANMLIPHRFPVAKLLCSGSNRLAVKINPTIREARKYEVPPGEHAPFYESLAVRKAAHMFGWDIMPRAVSAGLWRSVRIELLPRVRFNSVAWTTISVDAGRCVATIQADWQITDPGTSVRGWNVHLSILEGDQVVHQRRVPMLGTHGRCDITLEGVKLWWPRGAGQSHLYCARLEVRTNEEILLTESETRIGIRTIRLDRTDLTSKEGSGEFLFKVNGEPIFVRGTNWVQLDAFHSRDSLHLPRTLGLLADLNCNMVRCWGGNVYEDDAFYDFCDNEGIMVWQDFGLACGVYPQTDDFADALSTEAEFIVRKLRNHASIALWCGDNEGDDAYYWRFFTKDPNADRPTRQILPAVIRRWDPFRPFLPSSPFQGPAMHGKRDLDALLGNGDAPYWRHEFHVMRDLEGLPEVHSWWPLKGDGEKFRDYKSPLIAETFAHFISEIGFLGAPNRSSLERMLPAEDLWPWQDNLQWAYRSLKPTPTHTEGDGRIECFVDCQSYLIDNTPDNLNDFVVASQIYQAEALKFVIEFFRQQKGRRNGLLWWNLRDGWPQVGFAVVDYYFSKKLGYYYIKQSQQTLCIIVGEAQAGVHHITVVNDSLEPASGGFLIRSAESMETVTTGTFEVSANGLSSVGSLSASTESGMWIISWKPESGMHGENHYLFGPRPTSLSKYSGWLTQLSYGRNYLDSIRQEEPQAGSSN